MNAIRTFLIAVFLCSVSANSAVAANRIFIVDGLSLQVSPKNILRIVDVESGRTLEETTVGEMPEIGLSSRGDMLAVLTSGQIVEKKRSNPRLELLRTTDLKPLKIGDLPYPGRMVYMENPGSPTLAFSPDGRQVITSYSVSYFTAEKPMSWPGTDSYVNFLTAEVDAQGVFKRSFPEMKIPRCHLPIYLAVRDWPRIDLWNKMLGVVEVVDVAHSRILSRLPVDYKFNKHLRGVDPASLEKKEIGELSARMGALGHVEASKSRFAYFVPWSIRSAEGNNQPIQKIDLEASPPKIVAGTETPQTDLGQAIAALDKVLVVALDQSDPHSAVTVRFYDTADLKIVKELKLSITDCFTLSPSWNEKQLYALDRQGAKISVIDVQARREIKVLEKVGKFPNMVVGLPN